MRAPSRSPFWTFKMILPSIMVAILAYLGGYHYHTLAASQGLIQHDTDFSEDVVVLDAGESSTESLSVDDFFADAPRLDDLETAGSGDRHTHTENPSAIPQPPDQNEEPAPQPRRRSELNRRPSRFPDEALSGWQLADMTAEAESHVIEETTARQPDNRGDVLEDESGEPSRRSRLQDAIDTRRQSLDAQPRNPRMVAVAPVSLASEPQRTSQPEIRSATSTEQPGLETLEQPLSADPHNSAEIAESLSSPAVTTRRSRDPRDLKEATKILRELGIRKYKLTSAAEGTAFLFSCAVTEPENPRIRRRFVAEGDEPLNAVRKVLRQVEEWRAKQ